MKKIFYRICCLLLILSMLPLSACSKNTVYDESVIEKFTTALQNQNFAEAHQYFWKHASYEKSETFEKECNYILDTLKIKSILISNIHVESGENQTVLSYTCTLDSSLIGTLVSEVSTQIILQDRSTYLEYSHELLLEGFAHDCTISKTPLYGQRGEILTADGKVIAENNYADTVCIRVSEDLDITALLSEIDGILDLTEKELKKAKTSFESAVKNQYGTSVIKAYPHDSIDEALEQQLTSVDGVFIDRDSVTVQRYYPYRNLYFHAVGYTGSPDEDETTYLEENGYSSSSVCGREGLESAYNETLLSKDGFRFTIRDKNGAIVRTLYEEPAQDGQTLQTTLDSALQETSYYAMVSALSENQTGVVISLDPTTGAVKSFISYPSVDANRFSTSISQAEYDEMTSKENGLPLYNRATLGLYPPGSLLKPFLGGYALDEGTITENTQFPYTITGNKWTPENWHWPAITRNTDSGTPLVLKNALSKSDNIFFAWIGLQLGEEKLISFLEKLGFGTKQSFDLPTSTSNLMNKDTEISPVLLTDMAIGHGELLCTPIQMAALFTAFSNNGSVLTPYLTTNSERTVQNENLFSSSALNKLLPGLHDAVENGTARAANIKEMTLYAKTGTAIKQENTEERISWICIWGEHNGESLLTLVMIDGPNDEDSVKTQIAKTVMQTFYNSTNNGNTQN